MKKFIISELSDVTGTLLTFELILNKSNENNSKGKKTLVLKANEETESSEEDDDDETTILTRTFAKLIRKKENGRKRVPLTCYNYKKVGHMKFDIPEERKDRKEKI